MRALLRSFALLMLTASVQFVVVLVSGSVALLGDTIHNFSDALTALPIAVAFTLGRRAANRRYTYGHGRAEDLAGIVVVVLIAASAALAAYEAVRRLLDPQPLRSLGLVADGLHARTDGHHQLTRHHRERVPSASRKSALGTTDRGWLG
jgi:cation diffusion facilitator family transporter